MAENPNQKQIDKLKKQFAKNANDKKGGDPKKPKSPLFGFYWVYSCTPELLSKNPIPAS